MGDRRLDGLPPRDVRGGGERSRLGRPGQRRRLDRYFANLAGPPAIGALAQRVGLLDALWVLVALFAAAFAAAGSLRAVFTPPDPSRGRPS